MHVESAFSILRPVGCLEDRYVLGAELGSGGAGTVYAAHDTKLGIDVAVKLMHADHAGEPGMVARFEREASVTARILSVHVVRVLGLAVTRAGVPCIVYERLVGETLAERMGREGGIALDVVVDIVTQVSRALARIHALGIVHCDLKPENIFLDTQLGDRFTVKVLDFGVAETAEDRAQPMTEYGGTPEYMAPELLLSGRRRDARADLFALGVLAFECLTGRLPFPGEDLREVRKSLAARTDASLARHRPDLVGAVDDWMEKSLHPDPFWRFSTAKDMATELRLAHAERFRARTALRRAA